eukprot:2706553-Alexandrium_andersonii.AAC.1
MPVELSQDSAVRPFLMDLRWKQTQQAGVSWLELLAIRDVLFGLPSVGAECRDSPGGLLAVRLRAFSKAVRAFVRDRIHPQDAAGFLKEAPAPRLKELGFSNSIMCVFVEPALTTTQRARVAHM